MRFQVKSVDRTKTNYVEIRPEKHGFSLVDPRVGTLGKESTIRRNPMASGVVKIYEREGG